MNPRIEAFEADLDRLADAGAFDAEAEQAINAHFRTSDEPFGLERAREAVVQRLKNAWLDTAWGFFNDHEIQRDDEVGAFEDDEEAVAYVERRAAEGSEAHQLVLEKHRAGLAIPDLPASAASAEQLVQRLSAKYPSLLFAVLEKGAVGEDDNEYVPPFVVTWGVDTCNTDPFSGVGDARFPAHPSDHGIEYDDAIAIRRHNRICMALGEGEEESVDDLLLDEAVEAALDAGCKVIQDALGVKAGDFAALHWSGRADPVREAFRMYLACERANATAERQQAAG
jgi:hypothetical protein